MKAQLIRMLIQQEKYEAAIVECETMLSALDKGHQPEILRLKAEASFMSGDYEGALDVYETIIESGSAELRDYYLAAFDALYIDRFSTAARLFKKLISLGEERGDAWFESASYFYLAYAEMELGEYDAALEKLDRAVAMSPDIGLPIPGVGFCDNHQLRDEISNRAGAE